MLPPHVGDVRPSQLMFSFGIGSGIDLPQLSVMVMGLDDWKEADLQGFQIAEERLLVAVRGVLGPQVQRLYSAPVDEEDGGPFSASASPTGVPVASFPRWLRCPKCDQLSSISSGLFRLKSEINRPDRARYVHQSCKPIFKGPTAVPARFLVACAAGHIDDFPWSDFVHKGAPCAAGSATYKLVETGVSGEAAGVIVICESCQSKRSMAEAFGKDNDLPKKCRGRHPHLRQSGEECNEPQQAILLGASNSWFPVVLSTFSIPTEDNRLAQLVEEHWAKMELISAPAILQYARSTGDLKAFVEYDDETIMAAIEARRAGSTVADSSTDLKLPEWEVLSQPAQARESRDFKLRAVPPPTGFEQWFSDTVLVEKLREVHALVGFTRIASPGDWGDVSDLPPERLVPLRRSEPTWVPAAQVRGEGIFLRLHEHKLESWINQAPSWEKDFATAHSRWREKRKIADPQSGFPGLRYVLLHTLSHAIMRQICLECGYNAASIRERIYARGPEEEGGPMAGILIYTAAPDSQGTLGGLVSQGEPSPLARHLMATLGAMEICASDPLCAEHHPLSKGITLHGAACHACLFAPETSCERGNRYLDRATLVKTMGEMPAPFLPPAAGEPS